MTRARRPQRRWLSVFFLLLPWLAAHASQRSYFFKKVESENPLGSSTVTALYQDRTGYIWIATQGGLQRYNGYRYLPLRHDPDNPASLPDNVVTAITEDAHGRLWLGTVTHGLAALDPVELHVVSHSLVGTATARARDMIGALDFDPHDGLWIGNAAGIELMAMDSGSRHRVFRFNPDADHQANGFAHAADGTVWSATSDGLLRISAGTHRVRRVPLDALSPAFCVTLDNNGQVYVGARDGMYRVDEPGSTAQRIWPRADWQEDNAQVHAIVQDKHGRFWLAVPGAGLAVFDPETGKTLHLRHRSDLSGTLPDDFTSHLMLDRSGLLWLGGDISGVATTNPNGAQFRYIVDTTPGRSQMTNSIRSILEDGAGNLWLGSEGDGLKRYDPATDQFDYFTDVLAKQREANPSDSGWRVEGLARHGEDALWIATNHGAFSLDPLKRKATAVAQDPQGRAGLPSTLIRSILVAHDGSVWFGLYGDGISHWRPDDRGGSGQWQWLRHHPKQPNSLANDTVLSLFQDQDGMIWIGTLNGLSICDANGGHMRTLRHVAEDPNSLGDDLVRTIYQSSDGAVWIGTQSGLDRVDAPSAKQIHFAHYYPKNGLPGTTVYAILQDAEHNIWLSTNRGIGTYNRAIGAFMSFTLKDGLQDWEFNPGAACRLHDGRLVFGGLHGLNLFDPEAVAHDTYSPPVVITSASIGNTAATPVPASGLSMRQSQRLLHFEFAALDYAAPELNRFAYRLRGFDPDWIDAGASHNATYTNLPAGHYVFEVRGSNANRVWNSAGTNVTLDVTPVWWATTAMKLLYAALALALVWLLWAGWHRRRQRELRHHRELREREDRLRLALWGSGDEFWDWDMRDNVIYRVGADQLLGGQREETLSAEDWKQHAVHQDDLTLVERRLFDHIEGRSQFFESEHRIRTASGGWIWVLSRGKVVEMDPQGKALRVCGTARNITAARNAERERRIATEVIDSMSEAVAVTNLDFCFVSVNRAFTRMFGYTEAEVVGQSASLLDSLRHDRDHYQAMRQAFLANGHWHGELWQRRKDGEEFLSWIEISQVLDASGERTHYVGVINDITQRKRTEQELRYLANYDTLTGLPNRTLLGERLAHAVIRARRTSRKVALLFLDLDRFKHVNDSMGHAIGDRVLKTVGERLRASVNEAATVARLGGDEFTVVLEDVKHADEPLRMAEALLDVFSNPLTLDSGQQVMISPSIGISLYPDHAQVPTDLLKCADTAMYQAKEAGRNMYQVYTSTMDVNARQRAAMLSALRLAIEHDEFRLVYQPMLDLDTSHICGVEALLRWDSAEFGEVGPAVFIPLAEEAGMIERIGEFVLYRACAQLRDWLNGGLRDFTMSVNLSALQLLRNELTQRLCEILAELQLSPESLELELTESVLMANPELAIHTLDRLHSLGVAIAIDDFGTGYSSLSYLKRLPIDTLKIDRSFVGDITTDPDDEAITKTIISMAHSLGLDVVAEGVETVEQLEYLHEQGCDMIQGHWLSPPLDAAACHNFIREFARSRDLQQPQRKLR